MNSYRVDAIFRITGLAFAISRLGNGDLKQTLGIINTVAGSGVNGTSGDGGPASATEIGQPYGIAVDSSGNLYV